jgi:hypothetical protein
MGTQERSLTKAEATQGGDTMSTRIGRIAIGAMMATTALVALGIPTAQATTFDFGNVYFINNLNSFNSIFGCPTCMGAAFTASGLYQEINTTTKTIANVGSGTGGTTLLTEFAQNSSPSAQLVFTNFGPNPSAKFPNAPLSSPTVQAVQTMSLTNTNFQYNVGGSATQFDLNSIGLANFPNSSTSVDIRGFLKGVQVADQMVTIPGQFVGGTGSPPITASVGIFTLTAPGFGDVDKVELFPVSQAVFVNDITISAPVAAPAPVIGHGLPALLAIGGLLFGAKLLERGKSRRLQFLG